MHDAFVSFVEGGKALAASRGMLWSFSLNEAGVAERGWNLTEITGSLPPTRYLWDLGQDEKALAMLNASRKELNRSPLAKTALSVGWQDFIKAATCDQLLFKRNTTGHVVQNVIRPLKVLATCVAQLEPWELTSDAVREAISIAKRLQKSGKLADLIAGTIKTIVDANHLTKNCPLYPTLDAARLPSNTNRKTKGTKSIDELRDSLEQRKRAERLPSKRAYWELIRIVFTEKPRTFVDAIRFSILKVNIITGLRLGESTLLPADWARTRDYYDPKGVPAGELGGYSQALMLRYFAEKQQLQHSDSSILIERTQYITKNFEEILKETLDSAVRITQPLRDTLKLQVETGRIFPQYKKTDLVPVAEIYSKITGNPFWLNMEEDIADDFITRYRQGYNPQVLQELAIHQSDQFRGTAQLNMAVYMYFNRLAKNIRNEQSSLRLRYSNGEEYSHERKAWREVFLNIGELEDHLTITAPTKLSDRNALKLSSGNFQSWEFLYLIPKRALSEERNDGICDITKYCSVGIPDAALISNALGDNKDSHESLFMRYGRTEEDKLLVLKSHMLRHLQNTELLRLGVADVLISKHFNRRDVAQTFEYDNRTLAEHLESIDLPAATEATLGENSSTVAKLILAGKAVGPIVTTFKRIQRDKGDQAAFEYLRVEADGFHATPYGHCINSFTVEPCPKNLECFAGCCHLNATNLSENRRNLESLEKKYEAALSDVKARPASTIGRKNQLQHATIRLESVRKLLATPVGEPVFPGGRDLSRLSSEKTVLDD